MSFNRIPNICHFIFGFEEQREDFLFVYYFSVYSCWLVNRPDKINFYYHYEPKGAFWQKLKDIPNIELHQVPIPSHIGPHKLIKTAHKADALRMNVMYKEGGVYLDIDTICIKPFSNLLKHKAVLGKEKVYPLEPLNERGFGPSIPKLGNSIMFAEPRSEFFHLWMSNYNEYFDPSGWGEACLILPYILSEKYPELITVLPQEYFFEPSWDQAVDIFTEKNLCFSDKLISLHLWETHSKNEIIKIKDFNWCKENKHLPYCRLVNQIIKDYAILH
jgi:hypothetical protein